MSEKYSGLGGLPIWLACEIASTSQTKAPSEPLEPPQGRRTEITPTAAAVARKREGKRQRMLARLRQGSARTYELMALGGSGFSSRLAELRDMGFVISCQPDEEGAIYSLVGEP